MTAAEVEAAVAGVAALAEPVRRALYGFVVAQPGPVSREQAAAGAGVALHAAKFHLDKLVAEGLLVFEFRRPSGRAGPGAGRPAKVYRRSERDLSVTVPDRRYEFAGRLLARAVTDVQRDGGPVSEALHRAALVAGRALGHEARRRAAAGPPASSLRDAAVQVLRESGYEPRGEPRGILLANCPFHSLAREFTDLACGMNLDLMEGFVASLDGAELDAVLDPGPGRCCVRLRRSDAGRDVGHEIV